MAIRQEQDVEQLLSQLNSPDWWLRSQAAEQLGVIASPPHTVIAEVTKRIDDRNRFVRLAAIEAIRRFGPIAKLAIPALIPHLQIDDRTTQEAASLALIGIGPASIPLLLEQFTDNTRNHYYLKRTIEGIGSAAIDELLQGLSHTHENVRYQAISALGNAGSEATRALPVLEQMIATEKAPGVLQAIIRSAVKIGPLGASVLANILPNELEYIQEEAIQALAELGTAAKVALPQLVTMLDSKQSYLVARTMAAIGPDAASALHDLEQILVSTTHSRYEIQLAIAAIGDAALPTIQRLSQCQEPRLRQAGAEIIGGMHERSADLVPLLLQLIEDPDKDVRRSAIEALGKLGSSAHDALPQLFDLLGSDEKYDAEVLRAIVKIGPDATYLPALEIVYEKLEEVGNLFPQALANLGDAVTPLVQRLLAHPKDAQRQKAYWVIWHWQPQQTAQFQAKLIEIAEELICQQQESNNYSIREELFALWKTMVKAKTPYLLLQPMLRLALAQLPEELYPHCLRLFLQCSPREAFANNLQSLINSASSERSDFQELLTQHLKQIAYPDKQNQFGWTSESPEAQRHLAMLATEALEALRHINNNHPIHGFATLVQEEIQASTEATGPAFDPSQVRVEIRTSTIDLLLSRIRHDELDLQPSFQRRSVWDQLRQSRLIESLLLKIPLPSFYFDAGEEDRWLVIDGQQRLHSIRQFVLADQLVLQGLEFLKTYEGKRYSELPRHLQRRILETQVTLHTIEKGSPLQLKYNIFKRINTGGLPLSPQEIRHALYQGEATKLLKDLAGCDAFRLLLGDESFGERMEDQELVLRFIAFVRTPFTHYHGQGYDTFLNDTMEDINSMDSETRQQLSGRFERAVTTAFDLLGRQAIRRKSEVNGVPSPPNGALFECLTVALDGLSAQALGILNAKHPLLEHEWSSLLDQTAFLSAITQGTSSPNQVRTRFRAVQSLLSRIIEDHAAISPSKEL